PGTAAVAINACGADIDHEARRRAKCVEHLLQPRIAVALAWWRGKIEQALAGGQWRQFCIQVADQRVGADSAYLHAAGRGAHHASHQIAGGNGARGNANAGVATADDQRLHGARTTPWFNWVAGAIPGPGDRRCAPPVPRPALRTHGPVRAAP